MIKVEDIECFLFPTCTVKVREYYFYLDGEYVKADYCFNNAYGNSYCKLHGTVYNNVSNYSNVIKSYEKDGYNLLGYMLIPLSIMTIYFLYKLIKGDL